jgi:hypothetical protein
MELIDGKYKRTQVHLGKVVADKVEVFFNKKYGGFFHFSNNDGYSCRNDYVLEDSISSEHAILNYGTAGYLRTYGGSLNSYGD